jgi:glycerophosphoryl diester phosphodiesterase
MYTNNRLMVEAVKQYALNHKEDSLQIAGKLSAEEIEALRALIDGYYRDNELDPDAMASGSGAAQPPVPDGQLYTTNMTTEEISHLRFANQDGTRTQFPIYTFDDLLETFKGRCYINVDKFWDHPQEITDAIRRHNMEDQCIVKYYPSKEWIDRVEAIAPDLPSMPIVRDAHPFHEELCKRNMNYIGAEVLFADESSEMASDAFIDKMHADGKLVWVNSIIYNYRDQLAAGHSDDTALCEDMEKGWGWLADKNYDLIQTDWTMMLVDFLKKTGRYNR